MILLDQERCILCSRCVRFMEEVPKSPQLTIGQRGAHSVVETFADRPLSGNYQGNLADICPVGALTLKKFRFQARVWNLTKHFSTCGECSRGCAVTVEVHSTPVPVMMPSLIAACGSAKNTIAPGTMTGRWMRLPTPASFWSKSPP